MSILNQNNINLSEKQGKNQLIKTNFEDLENRFWNNIAKLRTLKKSSDEFKILCSENESILDQVHQINQG